MVEAALVLVTVSSVSEGERIANRLVELRLAACVNVVPNLRSFFWWEGKLTEEGEALLLIKTRRGLIDRVVERVKRLHSYQLPEVIALPIIGGSEDYLNWLEEETATAPVPSGSGD